MLGEPLYRRLADVPEPLGLVDVEDRCLIIEQRHLGLEAPR